MANLISRFKKEPESNSSPDNKQTSDRQQGKKSKKIRILLPLGILLAGAGLSVAYFLSQPKVETALQLSGRIEGYETNIGTKVSGRVESVAVREGNEVDRGQTIVRLDDEEVQAQLEAIKAQLAAAQEEEQQARLQIDVINSQIRQAQLSLQQSSEDTAGQVSEAEANLAVAEADLLEAQASVKEARSELNLAKVERDRYQNLLTGGAVSQDAFDQAQTTWETAQASVEVEEAAVNAAEKEVSAAQGTLTQAKTTRLNPDIRSAELDSLNKQLIQTQSQLKAAQDDVANVKAQQKEIQARMNYLQVISPISGVVTARSVEPGEVVSAGETLLSLTNLNDVYLRGYIPEGQIGKVRVGQSAQIYLDSAPNKPLSAEVTEIDSEASFTPENIYFKEDRVQQVFGVKLDIDNPNGFAKPGMPADGSIVFEQEAE
ncbi:efflux RND transporter periplasmic adaptor subunit [Pleurocapsales cyanobacterium LEGE 10410]|nr:efflux RND transporter periplasmic adaptor subunit [Pleurocapsales cyanobacterium LEGE 10410]